jgi:hypothetical protein
VFTRGPWDPGLLHGGPVGALFAEIGQEVMDPAFEPVRLTVDLLKPVPLKEMGVDARVVRTGRRLQLIDAELRFEGSIVARATLLALRPLPLEGDGFNPEVVVPPDSPDDASDHWGVGPETESFVGGGQDFRFIPGGVPGVGGGDGDHGLGEGVAWFRLRRDVFDDGVAPSPLARAVAASDVGGAVSARRGESFPSVSFINADISVHLARPPEGEWIRLASSSRWESSGIGAVAAELGDGRGPFGRANQALVLEAREYEAPGGG